MPGADERDDPTRRRQAVSRITRDLHGRPAARHLHGGGAARHRRCAGRSSGLDGDGDGAAAAGEAPLPQPSADLGLALGDAPVARSGLASALDAATGGDHEQRIFLRADKSVAYGDLTELMNALRGAGYLKVALIGLDGGEADR